MHGIKEADEGRQRRQKVMGIDEIKQKYLGDAADKTALEMLSKIKAQFERDYTLLEHLAKDAGISGKLSPSTLAHIKKLAKGVGAHI